ncbi:hypothetical protein BOTBODRAFT_29658 [Botryobasidium botryosum FD-172 SS1]|uniref:Uncharacterized protein n=1 Tax=Botryobasidium botryosum (strain FD-172 SS1) TaxID=930990 RepID=A0A067N007_BOTB1|nr:hypothetical protein BOTBODRAFT_29658 [Botryobasidium botryosum FD-172 SS1]
MVLSFPSCSRSLSQYVQLVDQLVNYHHQPSYFKQDFYGQIRKTSSFAIKPSASFNGVSEPQNVVAVIARCQTKIEQDSIFARIQLADHQELESEASRILQDQ